MRAPDRGRIVVGVDGSEGARTALVWALEEAGRRSVDVEVVAVLPVSFYWTDVYVLDAPSTEAARTQAESRARALVDEVRAAMAPLRPAVDVLAVAGAPAAVLVGRAAGAELLVVGSRGRGTVRGAVLGSVTLHCVAQAPCPVVVVHPSSEAPDVPARVVVGVDDSEAARFALAAAVAQAATLGARVDAVLAYEAPGRRPGPAPEPVRPGTDTGTAARQRGEAIVADVLGPLGRGTVRVVAREGQPRAVLPREAVGARLLVLGSRSRNEPAGAVLGSVALHCAATAPCPVLVVHPPLAEPRTADRGCPTAAAPASTAGG
jgi:nucleotide-binding universal stress UspA family protein